MTFPPNSWLCDGFGFRFSPLSLQLLPIRMYGMLSWTIQPTWTSSSPRRPVRSFAQFFPVAFNVWCIFTILLDSKTNVLQIMNMKKIRDPLEVPNLQWSLKNILMKINLKTMEIHSQILYRTSRLVWLIWWIKQLISFKAFSLHHLLKSQKKMVNQTILRRQWEWAWWDWEWWLSWLCFWNELRVQYPYVWIYRSYNLKTCLLDAFYGYEYDGHENFVLLFYCPKITNIRTVFLFIHWSRDITCIPMNILVEIPLKLHAKVMLQQEFYNPTKLNSHENFFL